MGVALSAEVCVQRWDMGVGGELDSAYVPCMMPRASSDPPRYGDDARTARKLDQRLCHSTCYRHDSRLEE
jgi:hypothetical protein